MATDRPVVIITGAGSGIGRACAFRFTKEGFRVVVVDWAEAGEDVHQDVRSGASPFTPESHTPQC